MGEKVSLFSFISGFRIGVPSTNGIKIRTYLVDYFAQKNKYLCLNPGFAHLFEQKNAEFSS